MQEQLQKKHDYLNYNPDPELVRVILFQHSLLVTVRDTLIKR